MQAFVFAKCQQRSYQIDCNYTTLFVIVFEIIRLYQQYSQLECVKILVVCRTSAKKWSSISHNGRWWMDLLSVSFSLKILQCEGFSQRNMIKSRFSNLPNPVNLFDQQQHKISLQSRCVCARQYQEHEHLFTLTTSM